MAATLYVVGVGPGDPELLTLKALRVLREAACIVVPRGKEEGSSLALSIVSKAINLEGKEVVQAYFPMRKTSRPGHGEELNTRWDETTATVLDRLNRGMDTAFITIGDPTIYSTFFYLYGKLMEANAAIPVQIVPGVSSITAAAAEARLSLGLGDERIAILPANYLHDLGATLQQFDTVVLMKVHKVFDEVKAVLAGLGLLKRAVYVSRAGMADQQVCRDLASVGKEQLDYFSMVIVKK